MEKKMNNNRLTTGFFLTSLFISSLTISSCTFASDKKTNALQQAISGKHRTESYVARDGSRHPQKTLSFFGVKANDTVVEIWPGGGGWYTEILAPYLKHDGKFYAAGYDASVKVKYYQDNRKKFEDKLAGNKAVYDNVIISTFNPKRKLGLAPPGSADFVLTFRNVHNWKNAGEEAVSNSFNSFFKALKPGGVLGVVEHRMPESFTPEKDDKSGYVKQSYVIMMAEKAGFVLLEKSEINANSKDSANHPKGVWTLPPNFRMKQVDREKYQKIGESDRMTLKFVKPNN